MTSSQIDFYDEKAAARIADVHPRTLRRWREKGHIVFYKTPTGRVRYRLDDLLSATRSDHLVLDVRIRP